MLEKNNFLVWADLEMTGLDLKIDEIVEIAVIITDSNLNILHDGKRVVIKPSENARKNMSDYVYKMHKKSGLLDELNKGISVKTAEKEILKYIKEYVPANSRPLLSGNSIATDRGFICKYMPILDNFLHYRMIDVSTIKELAKRWNPVVYNDKPEKTGLHRAYDDIFDSINELAYYKKNFFNINPDYNYTSESSK